jgi:hypothetical protein
VSEGDLPEELRHLLGAVRPSDAAHRFDHERVRVIFRTLDGMIKANGTTDEYQPVRQQLGQIWQSMLAAADPNWIDPEKKEWRERKFPCLDRITADVWEAFKQRFVARQAAYPHEGRNTGWRFSRVLGLDWVARMGDNILAVPLLPEDPSGDAAPRTTGQQPLQDQKILDFDTTVRDALNAVWICRLQYTQNLGEGAIPSSEQVAKMEAAVATLCENIIKYRRRGPRRRSEASGLQRQAHPRMDAQ